MKKYSIEALCNQNKNKQNFSKQRDEKNQKEFYFSSHNMAERFPEASVDDQSKKQPVNIIVLGMAGSGKTTFVQRLVSHLHTKKLKEPELNKAPYVINLDPACLEVPYPANVDIRDTVNYKEVMKQYNLGPNGGIVTSLNLFATKFDQVLNLIEKRSGDCDHVIFDTPGKNFIRTVENSFLNKFWNLL